jgi:hypothetical protein
MDQQYFRTIFYSVFMLTVICGAAATAIVLASDPLSAAKQQLFNSLLSLFMLGAGAIIGLIGSNPKQRNNRSARVMADPNDPPSNNP